MARPRHGGPVAGCGLRPPGRGHAQRRGSVVCLLHLSRPVRPFARGPAASPAVRLSAATFRCARNIAASALGLLRLSYRLAGIPKHLRRGWWTSSRGLRRRFIARNACVLPIQDSNTCSRPESAFDALIIGWTRADRTIALALARETSSDDELGCCCPERAASFCGWETGKNVQLLL